jgi:hypothetical protein
MCIDVHFNEGQRRGVQNRKYFAPRTSGSRRLSIPSMPMEGGSGEAAMSPPSSGSSGGGKRGRDPEEDVYVDNLYSHKRYLSEVGCLRPSPTYSRVGCYWGPAGRFRCVTLGGLFASLTGFSRSFGPSRVVGEFLSRLDGSVVGSCALS